MLPPSPSEVRHWAHRTGELTLGPKPLVMGILNVTPDSFSDGGRWASVEAARARAFEMVAEGADLIDVGGESTRPGAAPVPPDEELRRVVPVVAALREAKLGVAISVDTTRASTARAALDAGADIINDISGGTFEPDLLRVVADASAGVVLMDTPDRPDRMMAHAGDPRQLARVTEQLEGHMERALAAGIRRDRIVLDPGFGFGKAGLENYALLAYLPELMRRLDMPLLVGVSRKRMLREMVGTETARLDRASHLVGMLATQLGASVVRVHDVGGAVDSARLLAAVRSAAMSQPVATIPRSD